MRKLHLAIATLLAAALTFPVGQVAFAEDPTGTRHEMVVDNGNRSWIYDKINEVRASAGLPPAIRSVAMEDMFLERREWIYRATSYGLFGEWDDKGDFSSAFDASALDEEFPGFGFGACDVAFGYNATSFSSDGIHPSVTGYAAENVPGLDTTTTFVAASTVRRYTHSPEGTLKGRTATSLTFVNCPSWADGSVIPGDEDPDPWYGLEVAQPKVAGEARVGEKLISSTVGVKLLTEKDGKVVSAGSNPSGAKVSYSWYVGKQKVGSGRNYVVKASDRGQKVTVRANAKYSDLESSAVSSRVTVKVGKFVAESRPKVSGKLKAGKRVKATIKAAKLNVKPASVKFQWYVGGKKVAGATGSTYKIKAKDKGRALKVKVTLKRSGVTTKSLYTKSYRVAR